MAIKTIYQCDKCGKDQDSKEGFQLFEVSLGSNMVFPTRITTKTECLPKKLFCRDCMDGSALLGITDHMLEQRRLAELSPPAPVTLEDMIREIAEEAGAESAIQAMSNR